MLKARGEGLRVNAGDRVRGMSRVRFGVGFRVTSSRVRDKVGDRRRVRADVRVGAQVTVRVRGERRG